MIGEEAGGAFKTYHFDCRGSTVAITNAAGSITDTFAYDTYGKCIRRTGNSDVIFGYNGRDGVVTDDNDLIYMRARYYSPEMRRFVNADILAGEISNAVTLNRFAYANGNPVSFVDPFGLSAANTSNRISYTTGNPLSFSDPFGLSEGIGNRNIATFSPINDVKSEKLIDEFFVGKTTFDALINQKILAAIHDFMYESVKNEPRPNNIGVGTWKKWVDADLKWVDDVFGSGSIFAKVIDKFGEVGDAIDVGLGVYENIQNGTDIRRIFTDAAVDIGVNAVNNFLVALASNMATGAVAGFVAPGVGNLIGAGAGVLTTIALYFATDVDWVKDVVDSEVDYVIEIAPHVATTAMVVNASGGGAGGGGAGGGLGIYSLSSVAMGARENAFLFMN